MSLDLKKKKKKGLLVLLVVIHSCGKSREGCVLKFNTRHVENNYQKVNKRKDSCCCFSSEFYFLITGTDTLSLFLYRFLCEKKKTQFSVSPAKISINNQVKDQKKVTKINQLS